MGCSVFRKNNLIGRSFDFFYSNEIGAIIKTEAIPNKRFASIGVLGGLGGLSQKDVINDSVEDDYRELMPCMLVDGINENHVFIEENIITAGQYGVSDNPNPEKPRMSVNHLVRPVLDKATSAQDAVRIIANYNIYVMSNFRGQEETHYFIADLNDTYVVEWIGPKNTKEKTVKMVYRGTSQIEGLDSNYVEYVQDFVNTPAIMTNFYLYDWNHIIPELPVSDSYLDQEGSLGKWACGVERYKIIKEGLNSVIDKDTCINLLNQIVYTRAYTNEVGDDFWWTELTGPFKGPDGQDREVNLTTPHDSSLYLKVIEEFKKMYDNRTRDDGQTWESCHQAVYDIENLTITVTPHETNKRFEHSLQEKITPIVENLRKTISFKYIPDEIIEKIKNKFYIQPDPFTLINGKPKNRVYLNELDSNKNLSFKCNDFTYINDSYDDIKLHPFQIEIYPENMTSYDDTHDWEDKDFTNFYAVLGWQYTENMWEVEAEYSRTPDKFTMGCPVETVEYGPFPGQGIAFRPEKITDLENLPITIKLISEEHNIDKDIEIKETINEDGIFFIPLNEGIYEDLKIVFNTKEYYVGLDCKTSTQEWFEHITVVLKDCLTVVDVKEI